MGAELVAAAMAVRTAASCAFGVAEGAAVPKLAVARPEALPASSSTSRPKQYEVEKSRFVSANDSACPLALGALTVTAAPAAKLPAVIGQFAPVRKRSE